MQLSLPRVAFTTRLSLTEPLTALCMSGAFDAGAADFSALCHPGDGGKPCMSDVLQAK